MIEIFVLKDNNLIQHIGNLLYYKNKLFTGKLYFEYDDLPEKSSYNSYKNGQFHCDDGPAVVYNNEAIKYYYNGKFIQCDSIEKFKQLINLIAFE